MLQLVTVVLCFISWLHEFIPVHTDYFVSFSKSSWDCLGKGKTHSFTYSLSTSGSFYRLSTINRKSNFGRHVLAENRNFLNKYQNWCDDRNSPQTPHCSECVFFWNITNILQKWQTKQPSFLRRRHHCRNYQPVDQNPIHSLHPYRLCLLRSSWTQCCRGPCGFFFLQPFRAGSGILTDPRSWPCQPDLCCSASLCKFSHQSCWKWTPRGRITQLTQCTEGTNTASHAVQHRCLCQYGTKPKNTDSPVSLLLCVWGSLLRCAYTLALCDGRTHSFSGPLNMSLGSRSIRSLILCPEPLLQLLALILAIPDGRSLVSPSWSSLVTSGGKHTDQSLLLLAPRPMGCCHILWHQGWKSGLPQGLMQPEHNQV